MRANPYAVTNRSGGRSGWSGSALMVPGGISDGLAKLGQALVEAPLARRRLEQQALQQKAQTDRQGRQDTLAEALGAAHIDESKARSKQMQDDSDRKDREDMGRALMNGLGVMGIGPNAKGVASQAKPEDDSEDMTPAAARALAIKQAQAEAREGHGADPKRIEDLTNQFLGKTTNAPPKTLGGALAGTPAAVPAGVEIPPAATSAAGPASPLGAALSAPASGGTLDSLASALGGGNGSWDGDAVARMAQAPAGPPAPPSAHPYTLAEVLQRAGIAAPAAPAVQPAAIMAAPAPAAAPTGLAQALNAGPAGPAPMPAPVAAAAAPAAPAAGGIPVPRSAVAAKVAAGVFPDVASAEADAKARGYVIDEGR